jgi:hypothetical protein
MYFQLTDFGFLGPLGLTVMSPVRLENNTEGESAIIPCTAVKIVEGREAMFRLAQLPDLVRVKIT